MQLVMHSMARHAARLSVRTSSQSALLGNTIMACAEVAA
jgi:hypothetical protein